METGKGGRHRAQRPCWQVRVHRLVTSTGTVGQHIAIVVGLHAAGYTVFESSVKHAIGAFIHIGH